MNRRMAVAAWGIGISIGIGAAPALAYCRTTTVSPAGATECNQEGHALYWPGECAGFRLNEAASEQFELAEARSIAQRAFLKWMNPGAICVPSISVVALASTAESEVGYDPDGANENLIVFRDSGWKHDANVVALTTVHFDETTGAILDVDIEINTENFELTAETLELALTHEAGHFLGLSHSADPDSVMAPSSELGMVPVPDLALDDARAVCAIYPESGERVTTDGTTELPIAASACNLSPGSGGSCGSEVVGHGCAFGGRPRGAATFSAVLGAAACLALGRRRAIRSRRRR